MCGLVPVFFALASVALADPWCGFKDGGYVYDFGRIAEFEPLHIDGDILLSICGSVNDTEACGIVEDDAKRTMCSNGAVIGSRLSLANHTEDFVSILVEEPLNTELVLRCNLSSGLGTPHVTMRTDERIEIDWVSLYGCRVCQFPDDYVELKDSQCYYSSTSNEYFTYTFYTVKENVTCRDLNGYQNYRLETCTPKVSLPRIETPTVILGIFVMTLLVSFAMLIRK